MGRSTESSEQRVIRLERELAEARATITALRVDGGRTDDAAFTEGELRSLFDATHDAILITDDDGRYIEANDAALELFGTTRHELLGKTAGDFAAPGFDFAGAWSSFRQAGSLAGEFVLHRPDGAVRYTDFRAARYSRPGHHVSVLRDITDRKKAEEALAASERRYRLLVESSADLVYVTDPRVFQYVSPSARTLFGYEPESLVGKPTSDFVHPDDLAVVERGILATLQDASSKERVKFRARHADGNYRVVEVTARNLLDEPSVRGVVVNLQDVTDRERAQEELRRSEASLRESRAILEAAQAVAHVGSWVWNIGPDGILIEWSKETCRIAGIDPAEFEGTTEAVQKRIHPDDLASCTAAITATLQQGAPYSLPYRMLRPDGTHRWVQSDGVIERRSEDGRHSRIIGTVLDITDRQRVEHENRQHERQLRAVFDGAFDAMFLADDEGRFVDVNPAGERMFGVSRSALLGQRTFDVFPILGDAERYWTGFLASGSSNREIVLGEGDAVRTFALRGKANVHPGRHLAVVQELTDRKRAERAVLASERRFRLLVESSADVVMIAKNGALTYVSPAIQNVLGYDPEQLIGRGSMHLVHPDDLARAREASATFYATFPRETARIMLRIRHQDGRYRIVDLTVRDFADEPSLNGQVLNFHDVTEREDALAEVMLNEATLLESQATLERAQAIGHIGSWTLEGFGPEGTIMRASDETLRIYGVDRADFDGDPLSFQPFVDPADWEHSVRVMMECLATGGHFAFDARVTRADGEPGSIHVEGIAEPPSTGRPQRVLGTTLDTTARRRAEDELRASEARYRRIIETTTEGIWLLDAKRNTTFVNRRLADMLGYTPEELLGRPVSDFEASTDERGLGEHLERLKDGGSVELEILCRRKDGRDLWASFATSPLLDDNGNQDGFLAMVTDVTDRRHADELRRRTDLAERSLRETEEQLRQAQKLEALGQLAGGVAHDFNNILSVILGYTSILMEELPSRDPLRDDVGQIHEAGVRANELTRQLLAFGRKQVLQPRVLALDGVIARTEKMLRRLLGEDIELVIVESPESTAVHADPGQLEQVIVNLAVNARDAMPSGGRLVLETGRAAYAGPQAMELGIAPGEYVTLKVTDTGVGMDAATRDRIFEPFFTTKEKGKGTGLGLSTVFGIVKQSAGHVVVTSAPGEGTTFRVFLPATDALPEGVVLPPADLPAAARPTDTILLVEDEAQVRTLACAVLRRAGYKVLEAANAGEAFLLMEGQPTEVDILVTDVVMPRMGGHALATRLREQRPDLRVLYVSGYTDDTILHHGVEIGELSFLAKPFTPASLLAKIREVLETGRAPKSGNPAVPAPL